MSTVRNAWWIWHTNVCGVSPLSSGPVGNFRPYKVGTTEEKMRSPSLGITQEFIGNAGHVMPPFFFCQTIFLPRSFRTMSFGLPPWFCEERAYLFVPKSFTEPTRSSFCLGTQTLNKSEPFIYIDINKLTSRKWDGYVSKPFKTLIACCWARCLFAMVP